LSLSSENLTAATPEYKLPDDPASMPRLRLFAGHESKGSLEDSHPKKHVKRIANKDASVD
jgi:hypothetical protein